MMFACLSDSALSARRTVREPVDSACIRNCTGHDGPFRAGDGWISGVPGQSGTFFTMAPLRRVWRRPTRNATWNRSSMSPTGSIGSALRLRRLTRHHFVGSGRRAALVLISLSEIGNYKSTDAGLPGAPCCATRCKSERSSSIRKIETGFFVAASRDPLRARMRRRRLT